MSLFNLSASRPARRCLGLISPWSRWAIAATVCWLPMGAIAQTTPNTPHTAPPEITELNVFGDSLVDAGNLFNLSGFPPSPPYAQQLSNGPVWTTQLADALNLHPVLSTAALPNLANGATALPTEGINYALAGSLTSAANSASRDLPGLQQQITAFKELSQIAPPDPNALYVILAGGNDYNSAVSNPNTLPESLTALPDRVTDNLTNAAAALIESGAQYLLVSNLPDLGGQPMADMLNQVKPQSSQRLSELSARHNQLLSQKLTALEATSGAKIIQLDLGSLFTSAVEDPEDFGFTNVTDPCLIDAQPGFQFKGVCENPDEFLFWDEQHPTEAGHRAIAQLALSQLTQEEDQASQEESQTSQQIPASLGVLGLVGSLGIGVIALRKRAQ